MDKAIQKACESGYNPNKGNYEDSALHALNPLFWQCLGKAEGWGINGHNWSPSGEVCDYCDAIDNESTSCHYEQCWSYHWHRFIDHIAQGKDIDSFFNGLLK